MGGALAGLCRGIPGVETIGHMENKMEILLDTMVT